ncbi:MULTISPECIES: flagellar biosynthetic protein FliO [unclassified Pseudomonas]|nr:MULTISPECIES: flagellar biosynthetic protein FliO [unclassified Pseudomonas]MDC0688273.1 flagellar biosynthetic protein FliO [Mitsuaria sp. RG]
MLRSVTAFGALLVSEVVIAAAEPAAASTATPGGMGAQLAQTVIGLLLVVGLIFFLAWLLRRMQGSAQQGAQVIEVIGTRAIGPRDRLLLVQVGKEQILIGHTPGSIEALHVLAEPVDVPASARQATPEFAQRLLELMGKDQKDKK